MRKGYIGGLVDMLAYQAVLDGDRERARCVNDSFYRDETVPDRVAAAMASFPDTEPTIVLIAVMKQICGG